MRQIQDLQIGEIGVVFMAIFPTIGALWVFWNYEIPQESLVGLIKLIFSLIILFAAWKLIDLFIFNDKNKKRNKKHNGKKKKKK